MRWRSVKVSSRLFSLRATEARSLRVLVLPQRDWLRSSSDRVMLSVCQGHSEMTLVIGTSPLAIDRFSAARARRTRLALSSALRCWGTAVPVAVGEAAVAIDSTDCPPFGDGVNDWFQGADERSQSSLGRNSPHAGASPEGLRCVDFNLRVHPWSVNGQFRKRSLRAGITSRAGNA